MLEQPLSLLCVRCIYSEGG